MADISQFVAITGPSSRTGSKRSSLMQKIRADKVTLQHMSKDGLVSLMQKQQNKVLSRSALNDELLQSIKKAQLVTKKFQERISSLPDLRLARSRTSTSSLPGSNILLRSLSPEFGRSLQHGFLYRSDGNFRSKSQKAIRDRSDLYETSRRDLSTLKQTLLKATMIHCRNANGEYLFSPMLKELVKRESRAIKSAPDSSPDSSENLDFFRFITKDHGQSDQAHSAIDTNDANLRDRPLIGRRFFIKENARFINNMMQHIYLLERHSHVPQSFNDLADHEPGVYGQRAAPGEENVLSNKESADHYSSTRNTPKVWTSLQAKNSINMLYGVSSRVLESRQLLLDECMDKEMKKMSKTDLEIEEYIKDLENTFMANEKKRKESVGQLPFEFWKTGSEAIVHSQAEDSETSLAETNLPPEEET